MEKTFFDEPTIVKSFALNQFLGMCVTLAKSASLSKSKMLHVEATGGGLRLTLIVDATVRLCAALPHEDLSEVERQRGGVWETWVNVFDLHKATRDFGWETVKISPVKSGNKIIDLVVADFVRKVTVRGHGKYTWIGDIDWLTDGKPLPEIKMNRYVTQALEAASIVALSGMKKEYPPLGRVWFELGEKEYQLSVTAVDGFVMTKWDGLVDDMYDAGSGFRASFPPEAVMGMGRLLRAGEGDYLWLNQTNGSVSTLYWIDENSDAEIWVDAMQVDGKLPSTEEIFAKLDLAGMTVYGRSDGFVRFLNQAKPYDEAGAFRFFFEIGDGDGIVGCNQARWLTTVKRERGFDLVPLWISEDTRQMLISILCDMPNRWLGIRWAGKGFPVFITFDANTSASTLVIVFQPHTRTDD